MIFSLIVIARYRLNTTTYVIREQKKHQQVPKFNKRKTNGFLHQAGHPLLAKLGMGGTDSHCFGKMNEQINE